MTYGEMQALAGANRFAQVVPYHDPRRAPDAYIYEF